MAPTWHRETTLADEIAQARDGLAPTACLTTRFAVNPAVWSLNRKENRTPTPHFNPSCNLYGLYGRFKVSLLPESPKPFSDLPWSGREGLGTRFSTKVVFYSTSRAQNTATARMAGSPNAAAKIANAHGKRYDRQSKPMRHDGRIVACGGREWPKYSSIDNDGVMWPSYQDSYICCLSRSWL